MKIKELYIYGYGSLIDYHIKDVNQFQLFYGENEAGKSTIMSFIRSILFGFPSQKQTAHRYEPKHHSAYGGFMICELDSIGLVRIERIRGKSAGDVTIRLEDGTVGDETLLKEQLSYIDESLYDQIFTFNLQGIQEIEKLTGDDINRYLLSAGTTGSNQLVKIEEELTKEMDRLFLPRGQKPLINQALKHVKEVDQALRKAKMNQAGYEKCNEEKNQLQEEMNQLIQNNKVNEAKLSEMNQMLNHWSFIEERDVLLAKQGQLGTISFPIDGSIRNEQLVEKLSIHKSHYNTLQDRIHEYERELHHVQESPGYSTIETELTTLMKERARYEVLEDEIIKNKQKLMEIQLKIRNITDDMNFTPDQLRQVETLNLSINMKSRLKEMIQEFHYHMEKEKEWQENIRNQEVHKEMLEEQEQLINEQMVSEVEFKQLSSAFKQAFSTEQLVEEKDQLELQLQQIQKNEEKRKEEEKRQQQYTRWLNSGYIAMSVLFIVWGMIAKEWLPIVIASICALLFFMNINRIKKTVDVDDNFIVESIQKRMAFIHEQLHGAEREGYDVFEQQVQLREKWKELIRKLDQLDEELQSNKQRLVERNQQYTDLTIRFDQIKSELLLPPSLKYTELADTFEALQMAKTEIRNKDLLQNQINEMEEQWEEWYIKVQTIAKQVNLHHPDIIGKLSEWLDFEQEKKKKRLEIEKKMAEEKKALQIANSQITQIESNIHELYELANVKNDEEFRKKGKQYEQSKQIEGRLELIMPKLQDFPSTAEYTEIDLQDKRAELEQSIQMNSRNIEKLRQELATVHYKIQQFETGGTYTNLLHDYYHVHAKFHAESRKWLELAVAKQLLVETIEQYKAERLPKVMKQVIEYFRILTNGEYIDISFKNDDYMVVERKDRTIFSPSELSQGTKEQLYIAFRFSLVSVLKEAIPFPIIIDDAFVNFDHKRRAAVIKLLEKMSSDTQVLFFTCHEYMKEEYQYIHELSK